MIRITLTEPRYEYARTALNVGVDTDQPDAEETLARLEKATDALGSARTIELATVDEATRLRDLIELGSNLLDEQGIEEFMPHRADAIRELITDAIEAA